MGGEIVAGKGGSGACVGFLFFLKREGTPAKAIDFEDAFVERL
jgi:hypothetical protein